VSDVPINQFGGLFRQDIEIWLMSSETTVLLHSIRKWLLALTFLLGVTLATIARAGYIISGYVDEIIFNLATVVGVTIAFFAAASWFFVTPSNNLKEE
jgi:hypothetical protein